jgi:hypothetical protein
VSSALLLLRKSTPQPTLSLCFSSSQQNYQLGSVIIYIEVFSLYTKTKCRYSHWGTKYQSINMPRQKISSSCRCYLCGNITADKKREVRHLLKREQIVHSVFSNTLVTVYRKLQLDAHLTYWLHGAEPFFRSVQLCSYSRISQHFMGPEGSLPCSQEPYELHIASLICAYCCVLY